MSLVFKDKAGHELRPGDLIVYGHALGRCAGLQYGKVLAVVESKEKWTDKIRIKLRVIGVNSDWSFHGPTLQKPSTLEFSDRILRILPSQMPDEVFQMLNNYEAKK